jgi:predicted enzyme related to lactoylglutathione lyase
MTGCPEPGCGPGFSCSHRAQFAGVRPLVTSVRLAGEDGQSTDAFVLRSRKLFDVFPPAVKAAAMTSRISHTSFDAINAYAQSVFWSQVLDFAEDPDDPNLPGHEECLITSRDRSQLLLFITVPDGKKVKNRVHLDLRPVDRTREQEAERILALGASHLADHRRPDGSGWITLADPEGNEFCILSKDPAGSGATT